MVARNQKVQKKKKISYKAQTQNFFLFIIILLLLNYAAPYYCLWMSCYYKNDNSLI